MLSSFSVKVHYVFTCLFHINFSALSISRLNWIFQISLFLDVFGFRCSSFLNFVDYFSWAIHGFLGAISVLIILFRMSNSILFTFPQLYSVCESIYLTGVLLNHFFHIIFFTVDFFPNYILVSSSQLFTLVLILFFTSATRRVWSECMSAPRSVFTSLILFLKHCFTVI